MASDLPPIIARHGGPEIDEDDCGYVWQIPAAERCQWTKETQDCLTDAAIQYIPGLFCAFSSENTALITLGIILYMLWLLYLFLILGTTADNFFCPALSIIAEIMHLSDNIAGVTILAFGNGAPDIFTALVAPAEETVVMFNELIGAGVFVTTVIAGSIAVVQPFRVKFRPYIRDTTFYVGAVCWIAYVIGDESVHIWEAMSLIFVYVGFIVVVVIGQMIDNRKNVTQDRIPSLYDRTVLKTYLVNRDETLIPRLPTRAKAVGLQSKLDIVLDVERKNALAKDDTTEDSSVDDGASRRPQGLYREFLFDVSPMNMEDWSEASKCTRIYIILRAIPMAFLQFLIPVVNQTAVKRGWSKLLNCTQLCITPVAITFLFDVWSYSIGPVPLYGLVLVLGISGGVFVFLTTDLDRVPKFHNAFAFLGFFAAMAVVYLIAKEVYSVLHTIGTALKISDSTLGMMFLAWGNSIGDLISNVAIAKRGYPRMGFAACFGGPLFNTLLGMGLTYGIAAAKHDDLRTHVRASAMGPGCIAFLLCSLMASASYLTTTGYLARRSYGFMLYSIYFMFMLICILSEIGFIHPLGSDHRDD
ncbi:putative sodium/calcium exchanger 7 [Neodiprion lecontei]|uniref:Sodium/calcium exchanger 7 n=1 Tax=Neodiprion lecontei TaxID=441921 RepID=A0ABM3G1W2_NEOLC|nr:putative sodium/calcium exchanger 7 [Neodiprion lecontei]